MNKAMRPEGIWGAVLLPIDQDGAIDWHTLVEETEILCHSDLAGIYTNGSAGEFHNQTEAEFEKLAALLKNNA